MTHVMKVMKRFTILLLLICTYSAWTLEADYEKYLEAEDLYLKQEYSSAWDTYGEILRDHPMSRLISDVQYRRALCAFHLEDYQGSLRLFEMIREKYRGTRFFPYVPYWSGLSRYRMGEFRQAVQEFSAFLDQSPTGDTAAAALAYKAFSESALADYASAEATLDTLSEGYPESELRYHAAVQYTAGLVEAGLFEKTLAYIEGGSAGGNGQSAVPRPALRLDEFPAKWRERLRLYTAEAHRGLGAEERAEQIYTELLNARDAVASVAYSRLYFSSQKRGEFAEMEKILQSAEGKFAGNPQILGGFWLQAGIESYKRGNNDLAEYFLKRVWGLRERVSLSPDAPLYLAEILIQKNQDEEAVSVLEEYASAIDQISGTLPVVGFTAGSPASDSTARDAVLLKLGDLYYSRDEHAKAVPYYSRFRERNSASPLAEKAGYHQALSLSAMDRVGDALALVAEVRRTFPSGEERRSLMLLNVALLARSGNYDGARDEVRNLLALYPDEISSRGDLLKLLAADEHFAIILQEAPALFPTAGVRPSGVRPSGVRSVDDPAAGDPAVSVLVDYLVGVSSLSEGQYGEALDALTTITRNRSEESSMGYIYPYARFHAGSALYRLERYEDAAVVLTELVRSFPDHPLEERILYLAGWCFFNQKQYDRAAAFFDRLSDASEEWRIKGTYQGAESLKALGNLREAADLYQGLFTDYSTSSLAPFAFLAHADTLGRMKQLEEAENAYRQFPREFPGSPLEERAIFDLAVLFYTSRQYSRAEEAMDAYRRRYPDGGFVDGSLQYGALAQSAMNEPTASLILWEKLIDQERESPYRPGAMLEAAEIYARREEFTPALRLYADFLTDYPEEADEKIENRARELRFLMLGSSEDEAKLVALIEKEGSSTPAGRRAMLDLSQLYVLEGRGDIEAAGRMLQQVLDARDSATAAEAWFLRGEYYFRKGNYTAAAESFLKTLEERSGDTELHPRSLYRAAAMKKLQGENQEVRRLVTELEEKHAESPWTREARKLLEGLR